MYSGCADPRRWILPAVIEEHAERRGDATLVSLLDGPTISYRQLRDEAAQVASLLAGLGVRPGDRVAVMLPNNADFLRVWSGIGRLGAVAVILNTELKGDFLAHPIADSAPTVLITDPQYSARLEEIAEALAAIDHVLVTDTDSFEVWAIAQPYEGALPSASDIACIMYTSGTTGPPKGVLMPHAHCFLFGLGVIDNLAVGEDDHYYICLPLSHANGLFMQLGAVLIAGATATVRDRFSASAWLDDIRECGATLTNTLGAISAFVIGQAPTGGDADHRLRAVLAAPNHPDHERAWRERFGIAEVIGGFGMTEVNIPLYGLLSEPRPGACGKVYSRFFEVEIHDPETGLPVAAKELGEISVRPRVASAFMAGYYNLPEKTVEAWRGLWFRTGDAGYMTADGYVFFVDRIKDCIRRRGENVSAMDIEASLAGLPGVAEVAAYSVPSELPGGEDEIMIAIVCHPDANLEPAEIAAFARRAMPRFAQPRYLLFVPDLPKTGTEKVRKVELRKTGVTDATIDLSKLMASA